MLQVIKKMQKIRPWQWRTLTLLLVLIVWAVIEPRADRPPYTATLFYATPGLMAILLLFTPKARSTAGSILKASTVAFLIFAPLLIVAPPLGLAYMYVTIAAPALYAVGTLVLTLIELRKKRRATAADELGSDAERVGVAQWWVVAITVAFTVGAVLYRVLMHEQLGHSAAMFLGIPAVMAILLALTPKAKTVTGGILKGITLALLIVAPLLGEGYLCILMASPLFYLGGIVVGVVVDERRRDKRVTLGCLALVLLPMSLEGVAPQLSFNRDQTVEVVRTVAAPPDAVAHQLALSPEIATKLPTALRIGFPRPLSAWGQGLEVGATRTIHFAGAEGDPPGDLTMRVATSEPGYVRFETVSDTSKLTQWIAWDSSEVLWRRIDGTHTRVTWRVHFKRQLDPAWYFAPLERAAVHEAATYLIEANATPHATVSRIGANE